MCVCDGVNEESSEYYFILKKCIFYQQDSGGMLSSTIGVEAKYSTIGVGVVERGDISVFVLDDLLHEAVQH